MRATHFNYSICKFTIYYLHSFGNIIMYSSYNKFTHNVYRDANIVTTLDTFTSLLAGCCIFGILGNLAYELNVDDVSAVVKSGTGLAFISYPDAIAKFKTFPQIYAVLFFLMLYLLGIGSNVAMMSCIMTVIRDRFKRYVTNIYYACMKLHVIQSARFRSRFNDMSNSIQNWQVALVIAISGTALGSIYMTPVSKQWQHKLKL